MFHRVILLSGRLQRLRPRRGLHSAPRANAGVPPGSKSPLYNRRIKTAKEEMNGKDIYDYSLVNEHGKSEDTALKIYQIINK